MKNRLTAFIFLFLTLPVFGQSYKPDWSSLDKRPVPAWFEDSKFGIFIMWGVYDVPSWGPTNDSINVYDKYPEWYWNRLMNKRSKVNKVFQDFHQKTYGQNFKYQDFAPMFKAELFNADNLAELIRKSGAKYAVFSSNFHDGFTLWPSPYSWNWNSMDIGPHRDLCDEVTKAVRKKGLHMGMYYSLYEWFNPLYLSDLGSFVDNHMIPQMKDLVTRYTPEYLFTDGEWDKLSKDWKSEEFLAWLFNESPVKENIVVNDRWGSETRGKHGGIYTTEYGLVHSHMGLISTEPHPWEESRGMGTSYGFNRNEDINTISSSEQLITLLVRTVSAGGNFLLSMGPESDGTIPVIQQERLLDIGKWLNVNGEAIYGTRPFIRNKNEELINPETNKSIFFTKKNNNVYVIMLNWPSGEIILNGFKTSGGTEIQMLGSTKAVKFRNSENNLIISLPLMTPDDYQPAYVIKIKQ